MKKIEKAIKRFFMAIYRIIDKLIVTPISRLIFNIREYFSYLITSRDVENPKPSPEGVYKICDYYKIEPKEVLFLGDSMTDYMAAKQSGAFFLSYKNHLHNAPIINDHKDIIKYLY